MKRTTTSILLPSRSPASAVFSHLLAAGVGAGVAAVLLLRGDQKRWRWRPEVPSVPDTPDAPSSSGGEGGGAAANEDDKKEKEQKVGGNEDATLRKECGWLAPLLFEDRYARLESVDDSYREWTDESFRRASGFLGEDFIHSRKSQGPRVLRYFFDRSTQTLIGIVKFGPHSEFHAGLCHGGSMCAVMDDICGHVAFVSNGTGNWSGATIKVACFLKKPVRVGQVLKVVGRVKERKGRKSFIEGELVAEDGAVHATLDGITVEVSRGKLLG